MYVHNDVYNTNPYFSEVCTLRLDFESFDILAGTGNIDSLSACQDSFTVTNPNLPGLPAICGDNTGEHSKFFCQLHIWC